MTLKPSSRTSELEAAASLLAGSRLYVLHDTGAGLEDQRLELAGLLGLLGRQRLARYQHTADVPHLDLALPAGFRAFELVGVVMFAATAGFRYPALRFSTDRGATFRASSGDYEWAARYSWQGSAGSHTNAHYPGSLDGSPGTDALGIGVNHLAHRRSSLVLTIVAAGEAGVKTAAFFRSAMHHQTDTLRTNDGAGFCTALEAHDLVRLFDNGGAALTGYDLTLYGLLP